MAPRLKNFSDSDKGFENIKSGTRNVLTALGGMNSAGSGSGNGSSPTKSSQTAVCMSYVCMHEVVVRQKLDSH